MVKRMNNRIDYLLSRRNAQVNRVIAEYDAKIDKELKKRKLK